MLVAVIVKVTLLPTIGAISLTVLVTVKSVREIGTVVEVELLFVETLSITDPVIVAVFA